MVLRKSDFPQADRIWRVYGAVRAVASGNVTDTQIEKAIGLNSGGRQGRYYRKAAEKLGLLENYANHALLTPIGLMLATAPTREDAKVQLRAGVLSNEALRLLYEYSLRHSRDRQDLLAYYLSIYPGSPSTAERRLSTAINYFMSTGLWPEEIARVSRIAHDGRSYFSDAPPSYKEHSSVVLSPFPALPISTNSMLQYEVDAQKLERANAVHHWLVEQTSSRFAANGIDALSTAHIDLMATHGGDSVIYEMKSISPDGLNFHSQIRKAVAQLEEYRFRFSLDAALCVVTNTPVPKEYLWIEDYLGHDRSIAHLWICQDGSVSGNSHSHDLLADWMHAL